MCRVFDYNTFISFFPEFGDVDKYSATSVQGYGNRAMLHIKPYVRNMPLEDDDRRYAIFLMAGHLIQLDAIDDGSGQGIAGTPFKATIGSVQIENSKQNSFTTDDWNYWLGQTKYGRELLAFLEIQAPCGVFLNTPKDSVRDLV